MKKPELLAPAGSFDSIIAAINAGCDAIYLSGYMFGARQFAPNFSREELITAIETCHIYGVKTYVTVNTLIKEEEVNTFLEYIDFLHQNNVDAIIIQDLGMMSLVRQIYPNLEIHASTQMHVHNLSGVKLCEKLGLKRVVLARETSIDTINEIRKNTNIELEVFIHGAICLSYSGQCLMSSIIGGRSGNRGACAGPCRLPYELVDSKFNKLNKNNYILSTKDLFTLEHISELIESGVDSFKIEGRMKRPEYVYLVVSLYRKAIDSYFENKSVIIDENDIEELKKIFNRKFTKGFLFNENNSNITNDYRPNHLGIEIGKVIDAKGELVTIKLSNILNNGDGIRALESDVGCTVTCIYKNYKQVDSATSGDVITLKLKGVKKSDTIVKTTDFKQLKQLKDKISQITKKIPVSGRVSLIANACIKLELTDGTNTINVSGEVVELAKNAPLTNELITKQFEKLGNTPFVLDNLVINKDNNIYINNSAINEIRRKGIELLLKERIYTTNYQKAEYKISVPNFEPARELNILLENSSMFDSIKNLEVNYIYSDDQNLISNTNDDRLILKIPRVINDYKDYDEPLLIGEIGSLSQKNIFASDFSLNVTNSYTVAFLHSMGVKKVTLSYEIGIDEIKRIIDSYKDRYKCNPNLEVIAYAREEMMISKFSLNKLYNNSELYLVDRYHEHFPVREKNNLMYIYNSHPRNILDIDELYNIGVNAIRIHLFDKDDLTYYIHK